MARTQPAEQSAQEVVQLQSPSGKVYSIPKDKLASMPPELRSQLKPVQAQPQPQQGQEGMKPIGFWQGVGAGLNPLHSAPDNMPKVPGGIQPSNAVGRAAADMANLPEISARAGSGNTRGAIGLGVGTAASLAGPEVVKGAGKALKAAGEGARALKDIPMVARAADRAADLAREIRVSPEAARLSERFVEPLHAALDSKFEAVHNALEKYSVPINNKAQQLIRRIGKSEVPQITKIAEELKGRTALDYREAEGLRRDLMRMATHDQMQHWSPQLRGLADAIDEEIDGIAKQAKVYKRRETYRAMYNEIRQLAKATAADAKMRVGKLRGFLEAGAAMMGREDAGGIIGGVRSGSNIEYKLGATAKAAGTKLAERLGVDPKTMDVAEKTLREGVGKWMNVLGHIYQAGQAAYRGGMGLMGP